jgi:hypothetical protein
MIIVRVLGNLFIVAIELALVAGLGWLAWRQPVTLAGATVVLAFVIGLRLEIARLEHEAPFYFARLSPLGRPVRLLVGTGEAVLKALLAGAVALVTFSGTDPARMAIMATILAVTVFLGSSLIRRLTLSLGARPARWGYFRMAVPLGLAFSLALAFLPAPGIGTVVWTALLDMPARPSPAKVGEALFNVRQWIDDIVVRGLSLWLGTQGARVAAILLSTNVLAGFVIALYAMVVSEIVRVLEEAHWRLTERDKGPGA